MPDLVKTQNFKSIALIGNHPPRQCGIATFTADLATALSDELNAPEDKVAIVAMNDIPEGYSYPEVVKYVVSADVEMGYIRAARSLNASQFDAVLLQHEFGIFGGESGSHILHLVRHLLLPLVTTLHTVLQRPSESQMAVMKELIECSDYLVVMSHKAEELLKSVYAAPSEKIVFIPHGIPDLPFQSPDINKPIFGFSGRKVCLTFGLLSPNKGIEHMIQALPAIVEQHPDVLYVVLGATHPNVKRDRGEEYRHHLQQLAKEIGVSRNVLFCDEFVLLETLVQYLLAADIYVTPYLHEEQIVSGTLAYSFAAGNVVVSTPYWYATELLADGRGRIVDFKSVDGLAKTISGLLSSEKEREIIRDNAYQFSRHMTWKAVAKEYIQLFETLPTARESDEIVRRTVNVEPLVYELPEINLEHLKALTDDTGILQHAKHLIPRRRDGYCTDDNARALIVCCRYHALRNDESIKPLVSTYLAFLLDSFSSEHLRFRNFMSFNRTWLEEMGSEDSHGRALWSLGAAIQLLPSDQMALPALELFHDSLQSTHAFSSPRSWAFTILGLHHYLNSERGDRKTLARESLQLLSSKLGLLFHENASSGWFWPENKVTYSNAKLSQALLLAGATLDDQTLVDMGLRSLQWLIERQTAEKGSLSVIGNAEWLERDRTKSTFDQQPVDVMCLVEACATAFRYTGERHWSDEAERCFAWYLGFNDLGVNMYDFKSGSCSDGLQNDGANLNRGAEATLSFLLSLISMYEITQLRILQSAEMRVAKKVFG